ncbi:MAG TPA: dihydroxy-acid dehydratase [Methanocella sp.]|uniref:dihydroxy-acid dehydratase n=1 Tax=Methanocella sp. TaxID=2052833 RepID=UPI002CF66528|nr:dihydroxy-acid dehydratase [Methanocella sp.]HTY91666.1 dihydroxy-acid dehydratase [Methanocella sp.]
MGTRRSQQLRKLGPEIDPLKISMDWTMEDLEKPQVMVDDVWGDALPGSYHLLRLSEMVCRGVYAAGGKPSNFHVTDMCDGIAQGTEGMDYSLLSREIICDMIEIHWKTQPLDAIVLLSSCDKGVPAQLKAMARLHDVPAIHVPGGTMMEGPRMFTLERVGTIYAELRKNEISKDDYQFLQRSACPTVGCCSFMGTANTMQAMSETLGLAMPTSASMPAFMNDIRQNAEACGRRAVKMLDEGLTTRDILKPEAFENAIMVHAALGGSLNALLHMPTIAREAGIKMKPELWDELNRGIPFLLNVRPSGTYPAIFYWYAGGVQGVIREIRDHLHLDAMTVTGRTLGDNLKELERRGYFDRVRQYLINYRMDAEDIIAPASKPRGEGALAILSGNLAPGHAVVKYSAVPKEMFRHMGPALVYDNDRDTFDDIVGGKIKKGSVIVIRYVGPKGCGMPEMFYPTEALASSPELSRTTALVTDGRFSGASRGPCIGYVSPEAMEGGPIAVVEKDDLIEIDIPGRRLDLVGTRGKKEGAEAMDAVIKERLSKWKKPPEKYGGVLGLYTRLATSAMEGGYMDYGICPVR